MDVIWDDDSDLCFVDLDDPRPEGYNGYLAGEPAAKEGTQPADENAERQRDGDANDSSMNGRTTLDVDQGERAAPNVREMSDPPKRAEKRMTVAEKRTMAAHVRMLFFGDRPPESLLKDFELVLPNWEVLLNPFSHEKPVEITIDRILYHVNYVKLLTDGKATYFKLLLARDGRTGGELRRLADLTLEFDCASLAYAAYMDIRISRQLEWICHKVLPDSSLLFLACPRNALMFHVQ